MFRVPLVERYLSRVKPWQVVALWGPVAVGSAAWAARDPAYGLLADAGLALLGVLGWTLMEYVLHRWLFHLRPAPDSEAQQDLSFMLHGVHHDYPWDADRLVMPPLVSLLLAVGIQQLLWRLAGPHAFFPLFAGVVAGYLWYDLSHFAFHHGSPRSALGRHMRKHHLAHHFGPPGQRYGVTTPLWDLVFGTLPRRSPARAAPGATPRPPAALPVPRE